MSQAIARANNKNDAGLGPCLYGCIIILVLGAILVTGLGLGAYLILQKTIDSLTESEALERPPFPLSEEEYAALQVRIEPFLAFVRGGEVEKVDLTLSQDEVNALLQRAPFFKDLTLIREIVFEGNRLYARFSFPLGELTGEKSTRFINGDAGLTISSLEGNLMVKMESIQVKGKQAPQALIQNTQQFFDAMLTGFYQDEGLTEALKRIDILVVYNESISVVLKGD